MRRWTPRCRSRSAHFWQDVSQLERSLLFEQDIARVLAAGGFLEPSTIGLPRASLKGAAMMLAVRPPGTENDIAPVWLASNVT